MKYLLLVIGIMIYAACSNNAVKKKGGSLPVIKITTIEGAVDYRGGQYGIFTAKKTIVDTLMSVKVETKGSTEVYDLRWTKDSSYETLQVFTIPDSTGKKTMRAADGGDSVVFKWAPVDRKAKVHKDWNEDYPWYYKWPK